MNPEYLVNIGKRRLPHILVALTYWNFVSYQGGSILEAHHVIALLLLLGIVEVISVLCARWPTTQRAFVSLAIILWLDTQLNYFTLSQAVLASRSYSDVALFGLIAVLIGLSLWLLMAAQKRIGGPFHLLVVIAFSIMAVFVAVENIVREGWSPSTDSRDSVIVSGDPAGSVGKSDRDVPALSPLLNGKSLVHIVFDAHGSLGSDRGDSDQIARIKQSARESLLSRGFVLGTHAFSRYFQTHDSIPNTINFTMSREHKKLLDDDDNLTELKLFERMSAHGYEGFVFQTTWIDFCKARNVRYRACRTYKGESVVAMISRIPGMAGRLRISFTLYAVGFPLVNKVLAFYTRILAPRLPGMLPTFRPPGQPLSLMAFDIFDDLETSVIENAGKKGFYFAHVLMPHSPYSVDSSCSLRQPIGFWTSSTDPEAMKQGFENTIESRRNALEGYYQQVSCLYVLIDRMLGSWQAAGLLDDLVIVMHGDHGSRVSLKWPKSSDQPSPSSSQNDRDNFQAHFAYRMAGSTGQLDQREVGLQDWFAELFGADFDEQYGDNVFVRDELTSVKGKMLNQRPYYGFNLVRQPGVSE